jgi:hypothetical protein
MSPAGSVSFLQKGKTGTKEQRFHYFMEYSSSSSSRVVERTAATNTATDQEHNFINFL